MAIHVITVVIKAVMVEKKKAFLRREEKWKIWGRRVKEREERLLHCEQVCFL
jgi:hypothetical protein